MEDGKLGTIKEPAGVQTIDFDEVSPVLAAVGKIEASGRGAERPVGRSYASVRSSRALPRTGGYVDDEAGLSTIFGGRGSRNRLNRLDRIRRNLIGEHLALLIGDRLSVYRKQVRRVIAKTMEETVGIRRDTGRGQGDERAERRRLALKRHLVEQVAVYIRVRGWVIVHQVFGFNGHSG